MPELGGFGDAAGLPAFSIGEIVEKFGQGFAVLIWKDGITPGLKKGADRVQEAAWRTAQYSAPRVESYMKINAPWTDRTGNARNGLAARAYREGDEIGIVLFHQVPYGIYLETRFDGRYGIINPTIESMGPEVMSLFNRLLERM